MAHDPARTELPACVSGKRVISRRLIAAWAKGQATT